VREGGGEGGIRKQDTNGEGKKEGREEGREGGREGGEEGRAHLKADFDPVELRGLEEFGRLEGAEERLLGLRLRGREGGREGGF